MVDGAMSQIIKQVKKRGFEVVSTSYGTPVVYEYDRRMQSRVERSGLRNNTAGYGYKYSIYRGDGD
jgi:hypothetical protein